MSHVDAGPLANYNSLLDPHLSGYFSNTRIKKHLKRSGLVTRKGSVVTENQFRVSMARKEHRRQVRDMLATAIVHKTLDLERHRQGLIKQKLEEIANIELVKRVKAHRKFGYEAAIEDLVMLELQKGAEKARVNKHGEESLLPYLNQTEMSQSQRQRPQSGPARGSSERDLDGGQAQATRHLPRRPQSGPTRASASARRSELGNRNVADDDDKEDYLVQRAWKMSATWLAETMGRDIEHARGGNRDGADQSHANHKDGVGMDHRSEREHRERARSSSPESLSPPRAASPLRSSARRPSASGDNELDHIDARHLSGLDCVAVEKYGRMLDKEEHGRHESPYIENKDLLLTPHPPTHKKLPSDSSRYGKSTARNVPRDEHGRPIGTKNLKNTGVLMLHRPEPAFKTQGEVQTFCEVVMRYFGSHISLERDGVDPRHEITVEQQHCGGSTLIVFKQLLLPKSDFVFTSRRHSGYPFSLTFYVDGIQDVRLSACCEYKHHRGFRLGGKTGHFGFIKMMGSTPCYRCQVERESAAVKSKQRGQHVAAKKGRPLHASRGNAGEDKQDLQDEEKTAVQDYGEDFDADDGEEADSSRATDTVDMTNKQPSTEHSSVDEDGLEAAQKVEQNAESEPEFFSYGDDFENDEEMRDGSSNVGGNKKSQRTSGVEVPVEDDSDDERRRQSKDKFQHKKTVTAVNIGYSEYAEPSVSSTAVSDHGLLSDNLRDRVSPEDQVKNVHNDLVTSMGVLKSLAEKPPRSGGSALSHKPSKESPSALPSASADSDKSTLQDERASIGNSPLLGNNEESVYKAPAASKATAAHTSTAVHITEGEGSSGKSKLPSSSRARGEESSRESPSSGRAAADIALVAAASAAGLRMETAFAPYDAEQERAAEVTYSDEEDELAAMREGSSSPASSVQSVLSETRRVASQRGTRESDEGSQGDDFQSDDSEAASVISEESYTDQHLKGVAEEKETAAEEVEEDNEERVRDKDVPQKGAVEDNEQTAEEVEEKNEERVAAVALLQARAEVNHEAPPLTPAPAPVPDRATVLMASDVLHPSENTRAADEDHLSARIISDGMRVAATVIAAQLEVKIDRKDEELSTTSNAKDVVDTYINPDQTLDLLTPAKQDMNDAEEEELAKLMEEELADGDVHKGEYDSDSSSSLTSSFSHSSTDDESVQSSTPKVKTAA